MDIVHDIKPFPPRAAESTGSLTPSGSRSFAPIPIATPAPILPKDDPDYVWDVFYHRAGLFNDYDFAANVATLYVNPDVPYELSEMTFGTIGRVSQSYQ